MVWIVGFLCSFFTGSGITVGLVQPGFKGQMDLVLSQELVLISKNYKRETRILVSRTLWFKKESWLTLDFAGFIEYWIMTFRTVNKDIGRSEVANPRQSTSFQKYMWITMWTRAHSPVFNISDFTAYIVNQASDPTNNSQFDIVKARSKISFTYIPK